ncbi:MAG: FAD-dependent oxidoreductase [Candidatus Shapirobacteria bacterium]|nr:FAD-dependent oxidoreductase [Candidatus Shapirobacteria bacterium]
MNKNIAIVGAGLTGLVAGYRLSQKGYKVTIYEKNDDIGGLMGSFKIGDTTLEKAYHHIFKTDKYIIGLIEELGLSDKLKWHEEKTALYYDGQIYPFMGAIDLLKFKQLDLISKIRLGLVKIWLEKDNNWEKYNGVTAVEWMKKYCGEKGYGVIWEPLLRGKFHEYYDKISMAWLWARIHTRANSDGYLGYLDGGFQQIADKLAERIKKNGGKILLNTEKRVWASQTPTLHTGPLKEAAYLGAVCVVFTSKQSLSPYYWHNINDSKSPILCFIQHTNLVDKKQYGDKHVYYMGTYGDSEQSVDNWFDYLKKIYPNFIGPEEKWVFRFKNAQHIVTTNYKVPKYKIGKNLYQANFAQIFPEDRGMNFAVREGEKVAGVVKI